MEILLIMDGMLIKYLMIKDKSKLENFNLKYMDTKTIIIYFNKI